MQPAHAALAHKSVFEPATFRRPETERTGLGPGRYRVSI